MAEFNVPTDATEARIKWSPLLDAATIQRTVLSKFFGKSQENIVQIHDDLETESGDTLRLFLRDVPGDDPPFAFGEAMEGHEYTLNNFNFEFDIAVEMYPTRVPWQGDTNQRVPYDLRLQLKHMASDYWRRYLEIVTFGHLCGFTPNNYLNRAGTGATSTKWNGHNTIAAYASSREVFPTGETADEGLDSSGDSFTLDLLREAIYKGKTSDFPLRTVSVPGVGEDLLVCFASPAQVKDLRASDTEWTDIQHSLIRGGQTKNNALITGALTLVEGCLIVETNYVTKGVNSSSGVPVDNTRRAVLCGAQALTGGFGRWHDTFSRFDWVEEFFNYRTSLGMASKVNFGFKRTVYNSVDYGSILIHTYTTST